MNELKNKFVNVVVAVDEGRGFEMVKNQIYIVAKFCGRIMESDVIPAVANPMFNTELVWETEKKDLRKARADYGSIRVDCFTTDPASNKRDSVGYMMLLLRSAHILPGCKALAEAPFTWEKLRGVPDEFKKYTPTLRISFALKDNFTNIIPVPFVPPVLSPSLEIIANEKEIIPVTFTDMGFIKIGASDEDLIALELKITVQSASNLDLLLPKELVFSAVPKKYYFSFTVFGMTVQTRSFYRALHECITLNETVVISLQSSVEMLKTFFAQYSSIEMMFFNDSQQLGWTEINVITIIDRLETTNFTEVLGARIEIAEECVIRTKDGGSIPLAKDGVSKPTVDIHTVLEKVIPDKEKGQGEHYADCNSRFKVASKEVTKSEKERWLDKIANTSDATIQTDKFEVCTKVDMKVSGSLKEVLPMIEEVNENCDQEPNNNKPQFFMPDTTTNNAAKCEFKKYCLTVILDSIIWIKAPKSTSYQFHVVNQRAGSKLIFKTNIDNKLSRRHLLHGVHCHILYITSLDHLKQTLNEWGPQILMLDSTETVIASPIKVPTDAIVNEESGRQTLSAKVRNNTKKEVLAEVTLILSLEEVDLKTTQVPSTNELRPIILDNFIAMKQLEELEMWKLEQQQKYEEEMTIKIQEELTELRKNWYERKTKLEEELKKNIARCKQISKELKTSANSLEIDKVLQKNQNKCVAANLNEDIQRNYIKYSICENYELIETITVQERDLICLKGMLNERKVRLQELEKTALTGDQTKNLLQDLRSLEEKYETAQKAKDYFKEQWKKSAIEVHQLKMEGNINIQKSIQDGMDELNLMTIQTYVYDTKNDKNIEWKKALLKNSLFDEKVNIIEKNFKAEDNDK